MILRYALMFAAVVSAGTLYPAMQRQGWFDAPAASEKPAAGSPTQITIATIETQAPSQLGRTVRISADGRGHYASQFSINGRRIDALIDTGASVIALNRSAAKRLGISVSAADFNRSVNTANGAVKAAAVTLARVEIGRIQVRDVDAVILPDEALSGALIGMSFLNSLRFSVDDKTFVLSQ